MIDGKKILTNHSMNMNSSIVLLNLLRIALGNSTEWKIELRMV